MKKTVLTAIAAIACSVLSAQAQITLMLKGGANLNGLAEKPFDLPETVEGRSAFGGMHAANIGYNTGAAVKFKIAGGLSLQPELVIFQRGAYQDKNRLSINYLDIPILVDFAVLNRINLQLGPVISSVLWAKGYSFQRDKRVDMTDSVEPFSFGTTGGVVFKASEKISMYLHYYHGFLYTWDISYRSVNNTPEGGMEYYNRNISLGVFYKLASFAKT